MWAHCSGYLLLSDKVCFNCMCGALCFGMPRSGGARPCLCSWLRGSACTGVASELSLTARVIRGDDAKQVGLVTQCFADEAALLQHAHKVAEQIAAKSPLAVIGTKRVLIHSRWVLIKHQSCAVIAMSV